MTLPLVYTTQLVVTVYSTTCCEHQPPLGTTQQLGTSQPHRAMEEDRDTEAACYLGLDFSTQQVGGR